MRDRIERKGREGKKRKAKKDLFGQEANKVQGWPVSQMQVILRSAVQIQITAARALMKLGADRTVERVQVS